MSIELDNLEIKVQSSAEEASGGIDKLTATLRSLKEVAKGGAGLSSVKVQLDKLGNVQGVTATLRNLSQTVKAQSADYSGLTSRIKAVAESYARLSPRAQEALKASVQANTALQKLNGVSVKPTVDSAAETLQNLNTSLKTAAGGFRTTKTQIDQVATSFSVLPPSIQKAITANAKLSSSNTKTAKTFGVMGTGISSLQAKFGIYLVAFRRIASAMSEWVTESNDYVENLNLFNVAMGEGAQEAYDYAYAVKEALGIDPSEWMRNQGVFKRIASGFGVVEEKANLMSKNLTQIGYDISSFFNIGIEESMQKVQSGIAGELEPLRKLGYALDEATLQQVAYDHGIEQNIHNMTQAQKSQLRYLTIMEQSKSVMGDMARTVQTPANAMRILRQQVTQLTRAMGNLLIPFLQKVIPWVQAFVEVLTEAIQRLAVLVGFALPTIDYSGLDGLASSAEETDDALGGAASSANDLKKALLGIDELTILEPTDASGSGSSGVSGGDLDIELPEYDFLAGLTQKTDEIKDSLRSMLDIVLAIGAGFAAWKIATGIANLISAFKTLRDATKNMTKIAAGIAIMVTGFTLEWQGAYDLGYNGFSVEALLKTAIGAALGIAGSLLVFGAGPLGWTIGIVAALTLGITSFVLGYNKRQIENEMKERFGEIVLSAEEAKELAEKAMSGPLAIQLELFVEAKTTADSAMDAYLESSEGLSQLIWRGSVGLEVDKEEVLSAIDALVSDAQFYLDSRKEELLFSIQLGFSAGAVQTEMALFVEKYFSEAQGEMERLGKELRTEIDNALADGTLTGEELETIQNLQSEMNQILQAVADAEYKAKLNHAVYELGGDLSYESVAAVAENLGVIAQERLDALEEVKLDVEAAINLKYKSDGDFEAYQAAMNESIKTYFANRAEVTGDAFRPLIEKYNTAFGDVLTEYQPLFDGPLENLLSSTFAIFEKDETGRLVNGSVEDLMKSLGEMWRVEMSKIDLDDDAKKLLEETLSALQPSAAQLEEVATAAREAGIAVPTNVAEGLSDYHQLAAISGNVDSVNYLIGEKLSTDPNFVKALETAKDSGILITGAIADGFLNNTEIVNNANGTVSIINDTIGEQVLKITPELVSLFEQLGIDITSGLSRTVENEGIEVGKNLANGIGVGIKSSGFYAINEANALVTNIAKSMKAVAQIKSPSRLFRDEIGWYIGLGVGAGIGSSTDYVVSEINGLTSEMYHAFDQNLYQPDGLSANVTETVSGMVSVSSDGYDPDGANEMIVSVILSAAQQIVSAVQDSNGDVYLDSDKVGEKVTEYQNRQNRIYGKTLQRV